MSNDEVIVDVLDITRAELDADLQENSADLFGSALFHKLYVEEYDRYGGRPFASMIGLYEFSHEEEDIRTLAVLQRVCAAAHCPFISSVNARFFNRGSMAEVASVIDLDAIMNHPRMALWNELRDSEWSAYIGLTLPRYLLRRPWNSDDPGQSDSDRRHNRVQCVEEVHPGDGTNLLWGNAAILFAKNMVRSYESSSWAQHVRGPLGGGAVKSIYYPFKATRVTVEPKPGPFGWHTATVSVLPHRQFEGMDVELQIETALGGKA